MVDCCGQVQQLTLISIQGGCHCGLGRFVAFLCCISAVDFVPSAATNALDDGAVFSPPPTPPSWYESFLLYFHDNRTFFSS